MSWKTFIATGATILIAGTLYTAGTITAQAAKPPGGHLNIVEVFLDFGKPSMTIFGEDFDFGGPLVITLGDMGDLMPFCTPDFTLNLQKIECLLLDGNGESLMPEAGDYLLTVSTGNGQSQGDEYDLTIGAVGPQGEIGPIGPRGATGPTGPRGAIGPTGPRGAIGPTGPQGKDGASGADGTNGTDGTNGAAGKNGTNGLDGKDGITGWQRGSTPKSVTFPGGTARWVSYKCPTGKKIMGGGCKTLDVRPILSESYPILDDEWYCVYMPGTAGGVTTTLTAYGICAVVN